MTFFQRLLLFAGLFFFCTNGYAQLPSGEFARIVIIKPKPGATADFVAGYERHLMWHKKNNDPWTWYGWFFVLGDRLGQFMDGTFGHALTNLDNAVLPAEDAADNQVNVVPYGDFLSHGIYERLPAISRGPVLPDTSRYLVLQTFIVKAGFQDEFESVLGSSELGRVSVFKLRIGGPMTQYLLMRPAASFSASATLPEIELPAEGVQEARSELLRFQPTMSYFPKQ